MNFIKKYHKIFHASIILIAIVVNLSFFTNYTNAISQLTFIRSWGQQTTFPSIAVQIAVSPVNGDIYVSDSINNRIRIYDSSGVHIKDFGSFGTQLGELNYPWGIAIGGPDNNVYVADSNNHRVQVFDLAGTPLRKFGNFGSAPGEFQFPRGLTVNYKGNVYVADSLNHRVQVFDHNNFSVMPNLQIGIPGTYNGQFQYPEDVAIGPNETVYVTDSANHRVQVFTVSHAYQSQFGTQGTASGQFNFPKGIAISESNNVYVADTGNHRVQVFNYAGLLPFSFGSQGPGDGQFDSAQDIALATTKDHGVLVTSHVYVADSGNQRIESFGPNGNFEFSFPYSGPNIIGKLLEPKAIAVSPYDNNVYVADIGFGKVKIFHTDGTYEAEITPHSVHPGDPDVPLDIAFSLDGTKIYVPDINNSIREFEIATGDYTLFGIGQSGTSPQEFDLPNANTMATNGRLYVADTKNSRIQAFSWGVGGLTQIVFGAYGTDSGMFDHPMDVDVASDNKVYVLDTGNNRVQVFTELGVFIKKFGTFGSGDGQLNAPESLAVGSNGYIYIADTGNNRLQIFDNDGNFIAKIGSSGTQDGQFINPRGIAVSHGGQIYVADTGNSRVQEFRLTQSTTPIVPPVTPPTTGGGGGGGFVPPPLTVLPTPNALPDVEPLPIVDNNLPLPPKPHFLPSILPEPVNKIVDTVTTAVKEKILAPTRTAYKKIESVTPEPIKLYLPKTIMTSGLLVGSVAVVTENFFATPLSLPQLLMFPARIWSNLLTLLGIRKRRRAWGAVYDTTTKQPLDPVYLELISMEGSVVSKVVTDIYGRYSFKVTPGHYMLRPAKKDYIFPSLALAHTNQDEVYSDLYFGNYFEIEHSGDMISKNIPMDPVAINWREYLDQDQKMLNWLVKREKLFSTVSNVFYLLGFAVTALALFFTPQAYTIIFFLLYVFMYVLRRAGAHPSKLGKVTDRATGAPLSFAIVRLYSVKLGNEVIRKVTNKFGQFFCAIPDGQYFLSFDKKNPNGTYTEASKKEIVDVKKGVVSGRWQAEF